ncbi:MAG: NAD(P)/FAD-dependent oxidoreductase [Vicinamibacterales bacterium]
MHVFDVIVVGGGPAGSSCAWTLGRHGYRVAILDKATFPRDKVCAGWVTTTTVQSLALDLDDYRRHRVVQPISGFKVSLVGQPSVELGYDTPIGYGIVRREFDDYLATRSGAEVFGGEPVRTLRHDGGRWLVNDEFAAPMLVGAGGHFCPVARHINPDVGREVVVSAQEVEPSASAAIEPGAPVRAGIPELVFHGDLKGYGWVFHKGPVVNIGLGRIDTQDAAAMTRAFFTTLCERGVARRSFLPRWQGHAYLLATTSERRVVGDGVMLVGDAAGLAVPASGEGIGVAVDSGAAAARVVREAAGNYSADRLARYHDELGSRFGFGRSRHRRGRPRASVVADSLLRLLAPAMFRSPRLTRRLVIDRTFRHS